MNEHAASVAKSKRKAKDQRIELRREIDGRDETIRLLNEALSRAVDELTGDDRAAA